jgi:hypothetical protein
VDLNVFLAPPLHGLHGLCGVAFIMGRDHGLSLLPRLLALAQYAVKRGNDLPRHFSNAKVIQAKANMTRSSSIAVAGLPSRRDTGTK